MKAADAFLRRNGYPDGLQGRLIRWEISTVQGEPADVPRSYTGASKERYRCQVCGREGLLHCHEVWHHAEGTGRQWLAGLQALCPDCHGVKHITIARTPSYR